MSSNLLKRNKHGYCGTCRYTCDHVRRVVKTQVNPREADNHKGIDHKDNARLSGDEEDSRREGKEQNRMIAWK